jgi:hypothetical protein
MRDPLLPAENENAGAPTLTLRGTTLDLRAALADLLAFGPAAASRWGMAAPALSPQELGAGYAGRGGLGRRDGAERPRRGGESRNGPAIHRIAEAIPRPAPRH